MRNRLARAVQYTAILLVALTLTAVVAACGDSGSSAKEPAVVYGARCKNHSDIIQIARLEAKNPYVGQSYEAHNDVESLISSAEPGATARGLRPGEFTPKSDATGDGTEKLSITSAQKQQLWESYQALVSVANEMYGANSERTDWITGGSFIMIGYGANAADRYGNEDEPFIAPDLDVCVYAEEGSDEFQEK